MGPSSVSPSKAGLREKHLLRNIDNPNEVVVRSEVEDLKRAQAFVGSPDLREVMQKTGDYPDEFKVF